MKSTVFRAGLETLYFTGVHRLARPVLGGVGMILMFHRVRPPREDAFQPNRHLEVTPQFLADTINALRSHRIDIVSLDEAHRRLIEQDFQRRFAVLTFDDGYRDNLTYAWPILEGQAAPFTVYVASAFADGEGLLWWMAVEAAIARGDRIFLPVQGERRVFDCTDAAGKSAAFSAVHAALDRERDEARVHQVAREMALANRIDPAEQCREACMDWDELAQLARSELVTIGAHTMRHPILARLSEDDARAEMEGGARRIEAKLGRRPRHFAYPVGSPAAAGPREFRLAAEAGFKTAVTTRPGVLFAAHQSALAALPRLSINGEFQRRRYLDVLLSGAATAVWNGFRQVNAA